MNDTTLLKIISSSKAECFSTDHFKNIAEIISLLDKAVSESEENAPIKDYIPDHVTGCVVIPLDEWERKHQSYRDTDLPIRLAEIDFDRENATFTEWNGKDGLIVAASIYRLTGCYEMALSERGFDVDCFTANLLCHCSVQRIDALDNPSFGFAGM